MNPYLSICFLGNKVGSVNRTLNSRAFAMRQLTWVYIFVYMWMYPSGTWLYVYDWLSSVFVRRDRGCGGMYVYECVCMQCEYMVPCSVYVSLFVFVCISACECVSVGGCVYLRCKLKSRLKQLLSNYPAKSQNQASVKRLCAHARQAVSLYTVCECLCVCVQNSFTCEESCQFLLTRWQTTKQKH